MKGSIQLVVGVILFCIVGIAILQQSVSQRSQDERASVNNPHPRGLMLLHEWLQEKDIETLVQLRLDPSPPPNGHLLWFIPPPEKTSWLPKEVSTILDRVKNQGDSVLILCDPDRPRQGNLNSWFDALGVQCKGESRPTETMPQRMGTSFFHNKQIQIAMRTRGWIEARPEALWWPLIQQEDGAPLIVERRMDKGSVFIALSASSFQNDGLSELDHGYLIKDILIKDQIVVFDESHHVPRARDMISRAIQQQSVQMGILAFLLLIPLSLLGFAPREGDPPVNSSPDSMEDLQYDIHALAALYSLAGLDRKPTTQEKPKGDQHS